MTKEDLKTLTMIPAEELSAKILELLNEFKEENHLMKTMEEHGEFLLTQKDNDLFPCMVIDQAWDMARASFFEYELEEN